MRAIIFIVMVSSCRADFECDFGLTNCGISQHNDQTDWFVISGRGPNGRDVSGEISGGFFLARVAEDQTTSIFTLPSLSLRHNSGSLSFYYKLYEPQNGELVVIVCGEDILILRDDAQSTDWTQASGIRVYCKGQTPEVIFTARWRRGGETRIAIDDIIVTAIDPPTTATKRPTTTTQNTYTVINKLAPLAAQSTSFLPISTSITGSTPTNGTSSFDRYAQTRNAGIGVGVGVVLLAVLAMVNVYVCAQTRKQAANNKMVSMGKLMTMMMAATAATSTTSDTHDLYQPLTTPSTNDLYTRLDVPSQDEDNSYETLIPPGGAHSGKSVAIEMDPVYEVARLGSEEVMMKTTDNLTCLYVNSDSRERKQEKALKYDNVCECEGKAKVK